MYARVIEYEGAFGILDVLREECNTHLLYFIEFDNLFLYFGVFILTIKILSVLSTLGYRHSFTFINKIICQIDFIVLTLKEHTLVLNRTLTQHSKIQTI